ncbi:rod shape-determining protein MreD [Pseudooceanicola sp. MF1-13]|uniref:rod shape-determining protein MreD n=1 Tax=Pseudooceanicola sp. MF1-13 TaxID=3379095 RepID=UPI0038923D1D
MAEHVAISPARIWAMRGVYLCICLGILLLELLPLQTEPRQFAGPELMLLLTFTFALRRPEYVPAWAVGLIMLLGDFLLHRPPGLMAGLTVIAVEALRARSDGLRTLPFSVEWLTAALAAAGVLIGFRVVLALFLIPQAPLVLAASQLAATAIAYPIVVLGSAALFGVRRVAPGEVDQLGHRI